MDKYLVIDQNGTNGTNKFYCYLLSALMIQ
uniref:Uncharacterized protein n=1 Tax=Rhizophora mucronata TaxID=61149 RepID=A0A2P2N2N9_RHIMU